MTFSNLIRLSYGSSIHLVFCTLLSESCLVPCGAEQGGILKEENPAISPLDEIPSNNLNISKICRHGAETRRMRLDHLCWRLPSESLIVGLNTTKYTWLDMLELPHIPHSHAGTRHLKRQPLMST